MVQAVIVVAQEFGHDPGEFAMYFADFPNRRLPAGATVVAVGNPARHRPQFAKGVGVGSSSTHIDHEDKGT